MAAVLPAMYRRVIKRFCADHDKNTAMQEGMRALLRDRLIVLHDKYMDKGFCPVYARDTIADM